MRNKRNNICLLIIFCLLFISKPTLTEDLSSSVDVLTKKIKTLNIKYQNGLINMNIRSGTIEEIFSELKKETGINYEIEKEILKKAVTISFKNKKIVEGIKDILNTIGNPSYMLNYRKDKDGKYEVSNINIRKRGQKEEKRELKSGEFEIGLVDDPKWRAQFKNLVKCKVRAKDMDVNELLEVLSNMGDIHDKIIAEKIDKKIDFEGEGYIGNLVDGIIGKLRPRIYKITWNSPEWGKNKNLIKAGYIKVVKLSDEEIRHRRENAQLKNAEGERLMKQGRYVEAISAFEESCGGWDKDYVPPLKNLAKIYLMNNTPKKSIQLLNEALEITKEDAGVYRLFGDAYQANDQIELALKNYNEFMRIEKDGKKKAEIQKILSNLSSAKAKKFYAKMKEGDDSLKQSKFTEAEKSYKEAINIDSNTKTVYTKLGKLYVTKKDYLKAIDIYKKLQKIYPEDFQSYMYLGMTYGEMGKFDEAIVIMEKGKKLAPKGSAKDNIDVIIGRFEKAKQKVKNKGKD